MNHQNFNSNGEMDVGMDNIVVPTIPDVQATPGNLQRRNLSSLKVLLGMGAALVGYADKGNVQAAEPPMNAFAANAAVATSDASGVSPSAISLADVNLKLDQSRAFYQKKYQTEISRIKATTGQAQIMQARTFLMSVLQPEAARVARVGDDFQMVAINELIFEMSGISGRYREALQSNLLLTPDDEIKSAIFIGKEKDMLAKFLNHPAIANTKAILIQKEIKDEIAKRESILEAMRILVENPENADQNQIVGDYLFDIDLEAALPYLAKGTKPYARILGAKPKDAKEWWSQSYNEVNESRRKLIQAHSLALYLSNPEAYSEQDRAIFDNLLKSNQHLLKGGSRRVTINVKGAPEITAPTPSSGEEAVKGVAWINLTQAIDFKKVSLNGAIVSDGQGGVLFKGKDVSSATLDYPFLIQGEYDVAFEFTELSGTGTFAFVIPVADAQCMIMKMGGFVGIDVVNGERAMANKTKKDIELKAGVPHKVLIQVRKGALPMTANIKFKVDDELLIEHEGPIGELSITKGWDRGKNVFAIGNNQTNVRVGPVGFLPQKGAVIVPKGS